MLNRSRLLSMTFGRPTMISKNWNTPLPSLIDDEFLSANENYSFQPSNKPSKLGLLTYSSILFTILDDILLLFYADNQTIDMPTDDNRDHRLREMLSSIVELNRRLDDFVSSVPEYLKSPFLVLYESSMPDQSVQIQQQVLYCRY